MTTADDLRERARQCIRLAGETTDAVIKPRLIALGKDLIAEADEIEAEVGRVLRGLQDNGPKG